MDKESKPAVLTVREAASRLKVSHKTVYRLIRAKQLRAVAVYSRLRVPVAEIERFERDGGTSARPKQKVRP